MPQSWPDPGSERSFFGVTTVVRPCSEFPNDNTTLHAGAIFGCIEPCGPFTVTEPARALPAPPAAVERAERVAPGESGFFACAPEDALGSQPELGTESGAPDDELPDVVELGPLSTEEEQGFGRVISILARIGTELAGLSGPERVHSALLGRTQLPPPIAFALLHWRALLEGDDSSAPSLPDLTLDEWAAGFLSAVFSTPANELRGRVRAEGIAAFGVLDAA